MCLLPFLLIPILTSLMDEVCELVLSVSDFEVDETQTLSVSKSVAPVLHWNTSSTRKREQAWKQRQSSRCRCPRERQLKHFMDV